MLKKLLMAGAAVALMSGAAQAENSLGQGWYVDVGAGLNWLVDADLEAGGVTEDLDFDNPGWMAAGSVGYKWGGGWRAEAELGYRTVDFDEIGSPALLDSAGDVSVWTGMINILYDLRLTGNFFGTIGAGAGVGRVTAEGSGNNGGFFSIDFDDSDYVFAAQGILGVGYAFSDQLQLFADYRYLWLGDADIDVNLNFFAPPPTTIATELTGHDHHSAMIGIRYYFQAPAAPMVETPPPPPPPPAPVVKTFVVFFDFNKSNLTAEAQAVVSEAAAAYASTGAVRVIVTGHTDTVGSFDYNQRLSERRAASVAAELSAQGVPSGNIDTVGRSFSEPLVPTGPGVREPQNRRAVIDVQ